MSDIVNEEEPAGQSEAVAASKALQGLRREVVFQRWLLVLFFAGFAGYSAYPKLMREYIAPSLGLPDVPAVVASSNAVEFGTYNRKGERIVLQNDDKWGYPTLFLFDLKKRCRMMLRLAPEGDGAPIVELYDANGPRVALNLDPDGASSVRLFGESHKGGIALSVTNDGTPSLVMSKPDGTVVLALPEGTAASPSKSSDESANSSTNRPSR